MPNNGYPYSFSICRDTLISGDTLTFVGDVFANWANNICVVGGLCGPVADQICITAFNDFGASTQCDTIYFEWCEGVQELPSSTLKIYPNPATDELLITATGFVPEQLNLYDVSGQKVMEEKYQPKIDVGTLSARLYFIEVKGNGFTAMNKFVKQ